MMRLRRITIPIPPPSLGVDIAPHRRAAGRDYQRQHGTTFLRVFPNFGTIIVISTEILVFLLL